jgi:hypothetical protein
MAFWEKMPSSIGGGLIENTFDNVVRTPSSHSIGISDMTIRQAFPSPYPPPLRSYPLEDSGWRRRAIGTRLQLNEGELFPFDELETALGTDVVYVMVVVNGKGVMLEDERGLFPSDTLITQLRLISK